MYILDPDDAADEHLGYFLNYGVTDTEQEALIMYALELENRNQPKNEFNEIKLPEDVISRVDFAEEVIGNSQIKITME